MTISVNVSVPIGGDAPSVQLNMDASDAVSLIGELGKIANDDTVLTSQLLALLKDQLEKKV